MTGRELGDFGERVVQTAFPRWRLRQQPGSGNRWPRQEDLEGPRHLVQVKTTRGQGFMREWVTLHHRAETEGKEAHWIEVYLTPDGREAVIFERKVVAIVELGVGGERCTSSS